MTTKCTGIMGRIFGHKWNEEACLATAKSLGPGIFYLYGSGTMRVVMQKKCQRCGAVTGEQ